MVPPTGAHHRSHRSETAAWLMGLGALVEATGVVLLLTGVHDVGALLHRATAADGGAAAGEGTARMLLVVLGTAATLVWLALAGAVAVGAGWARWVASAYALAYLAVTGLGLTAVGGRTAWLGLVEAVVAVAVVVVLWAPAWPWPPRSRRLRPRPR